MKLHQLILGFVSCSTLLLGAADVNPSARYVQRTMKRLVESTAEKPATVRMLFYGQSIVEQGWSEELTQILQKRYPSVRFEVENKAIGGFTSELLVRTAEADLYPSYADIVFFNVYGRTDLVRTIVERLRARTTSEIVLWTSHVHRREEAASSLEELAREEDARSKDLASIASDNHCLLVHLRRKWCANLLENGWTADHYLKPDGNHLERARGAFDLYASAIAEDLVRIENAGEDPMSGTITDYLCRQSLEGPGFVQHEDGSVDFAFTGNRVEAVFRPRCSYGSSPFTVLLDGRPLSDFPELYHHGRVSNLISWMPLVLNVGALKTPLAETWKLTFIDGTSPDGSPIFYRVDGSRTGFDGEGRSDADFVSKSGRVVIRSADFHRWQYAYFAKKNPKLSAKPGQWVCWETFADFNETLSGYQPADRPVTILSGCANGHHTLTFRPSVAGRRPGVEKLIVYRPAGRDVGETEAERETARARTPVNPDFRPDQTVGASSNM